jgi:hypothetical protein
MTEGKGNGDLGTVAPYSGVPLNLQMSQTRIIMLLRIYYPRNREFGSAWSKLGGSLNLHHVCNYYKQINNDSSRIMDVYMKYRHTKLHTPLNNALLHIFIKERSSLNSFRRAVMSYPIHFFATWNYIRLKINKQTTFQSLYPEQST